MRLLGVLFICVVGPLTQFLKKYTSDVQHLGGKEGGPGPEIFL